MIEKFKNIFNKKAQINQTNFKIQSFTFFIPSPPPRSTGYREKQFDKLFYEFINKGYEILSFNTQACNGQNQSGMWILCVVRALNSEAESLSLNDFFHDHISNTNENKNDIDGLYYIHDLTSDEN